MAIKKSGPPPVLTETAETDLEAWVIGMQYQGYPVSREKIITKGNKINQEMNGSTRSTGFLGRGWIEKFMKRHPRLFLRTSCIVKRFREETTEEGLRIFL